MRMSSRSQAALLLIVLLAAAVPAACGSQSASGVSPASPGPAECPAAWRGGWQRLAERAQAPVYCPAWVPSPLSGEIAGRYAGQGSRSVTVHPGRAYLVSLIWSDASGEVHVNFGGYLHSTAVPRCADTRTVDGKTVNGWVPCFSDRAGTVRVGGITATLYTVNRGPDQWHLLYAWRHGDSLYTVSQHVAAPLTFTQVSADLRRMLRSLVLVEPPE